MTQTPMSPEGEALWKASGMTPDEQEARSIKYAVCAIVIPLKSGNYAVFANDRSDESMVIVDEFGLAIAVSNRANRRGRAINRPTGPVDLSDLGV